MGTIHVHQMFENSSTLTLFIIKKLLNLIINSIYNDSLRQNQQPKSETFIIRSHLQEKLSILLLFVLASEIIYGRISFSLLVFYLIRLHSISNHLISLHQNKSNGNLFKEEGSTSHLDPYKVNIIINDLHMRQNVGPDRLLVALNWNLEILNTLKALSTKPSLIIEIYYQKMMTVSSKRLY